MFYSDLSVIAEEYVVTLGASTLRAKDLGQNLCHAEQAYAIVGILTGTA